MKFAASLFLGVALCSVSFADFKFERNEYTSPMKIGARPRVTPHTMIFARIQPYSLSGNYLDNWIDRPLYHNSEWRDAPSSGYRNAPEVLRDAESAKEYEIEGFTMLGNAYDSCYRATLGFLKDGKVKDFQFMPGVAWGSGIPYKKYKSNADIAFKSPYTYRIGGKVPFFSYGTMPEKELRELRSRLAADGFGDILLFDNVWLDIFSQYNKTGELSPETLSKCEKTVREKLAYLDGVVYFSYNMDRNPKGDYTLRRVFNTELIGKYIAPLFEKVYSDPENRGKLLGMNLRHGYIGFMSGTNEGEYGTSQLREAMDVAILLNPDIISLVEWNEANENTSFQPNLANSKSLQRLIRYYARFLKGQPPVPNQGDDTTLPNMVVSVRQTLKLGEKYRIELLNIPDTTEKTVYTVRLELVDQNGKVVHRFHEDKFRADQLTAVTYLVPSETLADYRAVIPVLEIDYKGKRKTIDTLEYTRLSPTVGWNFKEIRQPLRDLLIPETVSLKVNGNQAEGSLRAGEPLASLELLDNEEEVYAFDRLNRFDPENYNTVLIRCETKKEGLRKVKLSVPGVSGIRFAPWGRPYAGFGRLSQKGDTVEGDFLLWAGGGSILLSVPKKATDAVIRFNIDQSGEASVPLSELLKQKNYGVELPGNIHVLFSLRTRVADHPVHIARNEAGFKIPLNSEYPDPCYQLRAVTESGKIYRSRPVFPKADSRETSPVNVFSATDGKAVTVKVPANRIETADYIFDPAGGVFLKNNLSPKWDILLGAGFRYLHSMKYVTLPKDAKTTAPEWIRDGDRWILRFDGAANYLTLPVESFPSGAFTLEFECLTRSGENQMLFRHGAFRQNSLDTYLVDGKLQASFYSMGYNFEGILREFPVNLEFPRDRWNQVKISYDLNTLRFEVNGKVQSFPFALRAAKAAAGTFGGEYGSDTQTKKYGLHYFNGDLRSLKITRNAE